MADGLKRLDIFPKFDAKFEQDAREKTVLGACLSMSSLVVIALLIVGEVRYFLSIEERNELYVDTDIDGSLEITVNVSFPEVPCDLMSLDAVDSFGEFQSDMDKKTVKHRIDRNMNIIERAEELVNLKSVATVPRDENGNAKPECSSCHGAESHPGECCNSCEAVRMAYERKGWSFHLNDVSIVQCDIHFIPARAFVHLGHHVHDLSGDDGNETHSC